MTAKDFPSLCISTKYLTPSTQEIRRHRGRVLFEGRYYTCFNRLETFFKRQWQKILRIFHIIKKDTQLNNNDLLNVIEKYTKQIHNNIDKIDPLTLQPHVETTRKKIELLSKCISNKTEVARKDRLLAKCDELDLELRKKRALAAAERAKKAAAGADDAANKASLAKISATNSLNQITDHQTPAAIVIQRAYRQYISNKKAAQANQPSLFSKITAAGWNTLTSIPRSALVMTAKGVGQMISPEVGKGVSDTIMTCGAVLAGKEIYTAAKEAISGRPGDATKRLVNVAVQGVMAIAPMVSPEIAEAQRLAKQQALMDNAFQH